jgi:hypothetical protein
MSAFIADGQTRRGFLKGVPNLHEDVRFRYRPATVSEASEFFESGAGLGARAAEERTAEFIARHLVDWSIHAEGGLVPPTAANLLRLVPKVYNQLAAVILGNQGGDTDPEWEQEAKAQKARHERSAQAAGRTVGQVAEEESGKNS